MRKIRHPGLRRRGGHGAMALVVFLSSIAWGNNHHDHLYAVPSAADFSASFSHIRKIPDVFHNVFRDRSSGVLKVSLAKLHFALALNRLVTDSNIHSALDNLGPDSTVEDVLAHLYPGEKLTGAHLEPLLNFPDGAAARALSAGMRRTIYVSVENIRRQILLSLATNGRYGGQQVANEIFSAYFRREQQVNRGVLDVSVPRTLFPTSWRSSERRFMQPNALDFLTKLHSDAEAARTELRLFYSVGRSDILNGADLRRLRFQLEDLMLFARYLDRPILGGIDIAGSIGERDQSDGNERELQRVIENFHEFFDMCARFKIPLRIHAFEGANRGLFYQALWYAIEEYRGDPLAIRIGHTNKLTKAWIGDAAADRGSAAYLGALRANERISVVLESNFVSNHVLQDASLASLVNTARMAKAVGHTVVPGGDGGGFLPGASFTDVTRWMDRENQFFTFDSLHPHGWTCGALLSNVVF